MYLPLKSYGYQIGFKWSHESAFACCQTPETHFTITFLAALSLRGSTWIRNGNASPSQEKLVDAPKQYIWILVLNFLGNSEGEPRHINHKSL